MKIDNEFTVNAPIERAWALLTDLEAIAPCLPGAQLTGMEGDAYLGKVKIKVGPVTAEYAGTARFAEKDDAGYRAVIDARGRDSRGAGNASALITAQLREEDSHTVVTVDTDLKISGKIAQFGSGMIKEVSQKLLGQFVNCLEGKLTAPEIPVTDAVDSIGHEDKSESQVGIADQDGATIVAAPVAGSAPTPAPATGSTPAAGSVSAPAAHREFTASPEPEALDLMGLAGGSIYKRLLPVAGAAVVIVAVIIYFIVK